MSTTVLNVKDFGAKGDGESLDTAAVQSAIKACAELGGGTLWFPAGDYICGTLYLCDNLTIHLDAGGVLHEAYQEGIEAHRVGPGIERPHFIVGLSVKNIAFTGSGSILGNGESNNPGEDRDTRGFRSGLIYLEYCTRIRFEGIQIRFGCSWTVHLTRCEDVYFVNTSILNNLYRRGGNDCLDLNSCKNVMISNCRMQAWDDCIVIKTKDLETVDDAIDFPSENIVATNCSFISGCTALKLGSESKGNFRDIHFSNSVIRDSSVGLGMFILDGAVVENVTFSGISMQLVGDRRYREHDPDEHVHIFPICLFVGKRTPESRLGKIRDVIFRDLQIQTHYGSVLLGHEDSPLENISFDNVTVRCGKVLPHTARVMPCSRGGSVEPEGGTKGSPFVLGYTRGMQIRNVKVFWPEGETDVPDDVSIDATADVSV